MDVTAVLGSLIGAGASAATGGIFGLVGNVATKAISIWQDSADTKKALALAAIQSAQKDKQNAHDLDVLKLQMQAKDQDTRDQIAIIAAQGAQTGLTASIGAEAATGAGTYPWVNAVRALVRPVLTLGLASFLACAFFAMPAGDIDRAYVADSLVFAAVTAIVWWFGDRAPKRSIQS